MARSTLPFSFPRATATGRGYWVEADGIAAALKDGAFEVVVHNDPGAAAEGGEGLGVTTDEGCPVCVEEEAQEDPARVAPHHDEGHQRAACAADLQVAEAPPVDLRLLAWQVRRRR